MQLNSIEQPIDADAARARRLRRVTNPYRVNDNDEYLWLERAYRQFEACGVPAAVVAAGHGKVAVWRL